MVDDLNLIPFRNCARGYRSPRLIYVLTPEFFRSDLSELQSYETDSNALLIRLKPCAIPEELKFTSYIDLSFKDMTDITLQGKLLPKLMSTLQLPKSVCS